MKTPRPKMIIFDYGGTLAHEPFPDTLRGYSQVHKHVVANPNKVTAKELDKFGSDLFQEMWQHRHIGYEIHEWNFMRFVLEYLELELDITIPEAELLFMNGNSKCVPTPGIEDLLGYLHGRGIRSAVISNIGYSGAALADRLERLLPDGHHFEFIIATSEYVIRKPNPMIFELAAKKAGLSTADIWYCGDSLKADIMGSASAGMFPVWYDNPDYTNPWRKREEEYKPDIPYLHICDWKELEKTLEVIL